MTKWKAQGIAVLVWIVVVLALARLVPVHGGLFSMGDSAWVVLALYLGFYGAILVASTTVVVAVWRQATPRAVVGLHVGVAVVAWMVGQAVASWGG